ncbi:Uncharacterised protein [Mycolicibacterium aurum]|uniref:Uncharacterized protein n=1 Tax=Mycolicibacterium aurum TaxID=1791 RepID=A0A448IRB3_MYCAU|nr:Uncharacterised protein [Mycolicibacterium aurum]
MTPLGAIVVCMKHVAMSRGEFADVWSTAAAVPLARSVNHDGDAPQTESGAFSNDAIPRGNR